uniref:CS domain-containing protein n=1 Tax=Chaetoceros debilis TaxID=122233 RepID=A0A7S3V6J3_9STRA|mmetsp:Transcript_16148/g.24202  ORF Transcript_16148/g.24202 Transcript_16148/m.24202 type:complete len:353 (+) Transcript_16148:84-1142(+)|eukprot:CAMPEP_0194095382 /NCGR_PEP_ID=MMETSP0149-20130528/56799_1 /TAXON_ID=122233 /ORGANISM="Chaetoceros debilis, Strain MM31A-1" /LENGTH=352 /DNA_ID=CAMNT_0038781323 /DNA_START=69 /DNA_END=1127 /DNA_ORIENTATION=+
MFKYVFIPAEESEPISSKSLSKAGGLSADELSKTAKEYFFEQSGGAARKIIIDNASPAEKKQIAKQIRDQYASTPSASQINSMEDDALLEIIKSTQASATCEITCITVPTPTNSHQAVSMYGDDNARNRDSPFNKRATDLMRATGHGLPADNSNADGKPSGIFGDVFVGRCHDNEVADIWERVDFTEDDITGDLSKVEWCRTARKKGGGGGHGGAPASLSSTLSNMTAQQNGAGANASAIGAGAAPSTGTTGTPGDNEENGYKWSQTDDEVEIRFAVPSNTKAKYVKVKYGIQSLKVSMSGTTLCEGETWGHITVDDSTYTIQDDSDTGGRELCITLGKKEAEQWNYAVMKK